MLTDATKGKPFKFEPLTIEARDCRFLPFVTVVKDGADVVVMNMDPVMHDIQAYETSQLGPRVLFNTPLPMNPHHKRRGDRESHEHLAGEPVKEEHSYDQGPAFVCYAMWVSCLHGKLGIRGGQSLLCPDWRRWDVHADGCAAWRIYPDGMAPRRWNDRCKKHVTVTGKDVTTADFSFDAPKGRRSVHEIEENPHYGPESLGKVVDIRPTLQHQVP